MNAKRENVYTASKWAWPGATAGRIARLVALLTLCFAHTALAQEDGENPLDPPNGDPDAPNAAQLSESQTAYFGARLLCGPDADSPNCPKAARGQVGFQRLEVGDYADHEARDRYAFWQGDSLFVGVVDEDGGNRIDAVAEFYWFESSVERGSDFYVVVLKVAAAPAPTTNWRIATPPSIADEVLLRDIGPAQRVKARMDRSGQFGTIRWDWSVPFQNYRWEPARVIEVEQEYTAGIMAEGTAMRSITEGVNVQAKGFVNANAKVSTRYTITLWRWEMRVQPGATQMTWDLTALDPEHEHDPAYHEYFLVMQAPRGREARLEALDFGATFRNRRGGLLDYVIPDAFHEVSTRVADIVLTPPQVANCPEGFAETENGCIPICEDGFKPVNGECIPDCPMGFIPENDSCVPDCQEGYEPRGNRCEPICEMHERYYRGRCIPYCDEGERVEGEACVPVCTDGTRLENGNCVSVCDEGEQFENNRCVSTCGDNEVLRDGECEPGCGRGLTLVNGQCMFNCEEGTHLEDNRCVPDCGPGYRSVSGRCVLDCPPGTSEVAGRCQRAIQCADGTRLQNGQCIPIGGTVGTDGKDTDSRQAASAEGGCSVSGGTSNSGAVLMLLAILGIGLRRRRA
jgi:MYXO-CTERM domain-containing protein